MLVLQSTRDEAPLPHTQMRKSKLRKIIEMFALIYPPPKDDRVFKVEAAARMLSNVKKRHWQIRWERLVH
jgi:hypothetical protein